MPAPHRRVLSALRERAPLAYVTAPWAHLSDAQVSLLRVESLLASLPDEITRRMECLIMATDRALSNTLLAVLPVILTRVSEVIEDSARKDQKIVDLTGERDGLLSELGREREAAATDEAEDTANLQPLAEAIEQLRQKVIPAANENPDVTPVPVIEDVPPVLSGEVDPGAGDSGTFDDGVF